MQIRVAKNESITGLQLLYLLALVVALELAVFTLAPSAAVPVTMVLAFVLFGGWFRKRVPVWRKKGVGIANPWAPDFDEPPHMAEQRKLVRTLRAGAQESARTGDMDRAAKYIAAAVRLSCDTPAHSAQEAMLALAALRMAAGLAIEYTGRWNASQRDQMLAELHKAQRKINGQTLPDGLADRHEQRFYTCRRAAMSSVDAAVKVLERRE